MISSSYIENLFNEFNAENKYFIVDLKVSVSNQINILADSFEGITINECVEISRFIEHKLDRDNEDFELQVSSPGIDTPLKLPVQFQKNVGRTLKVVTNEGVQYEGELTRIENNILTIVFQEKVLPEGKKRKKWVSCSKEIDINNIKNAKVVISFK